MPPSDPNNKPLSLSRSAPGGDLNPARTPIPVPGNQLMIAGPERPAAPPPGLSSAPSANALLQALRRRWLPAVVVATVGALAVVAVVLQVVPAKYNAEARVLVSSRGPSTSFDNTEQPVEWSIRKNNIKGLIKSSPVIKAALNDPKVANLPVVLEQVEPTAWLESAVKVEFDGSEIVRIMMSGQDPEELQALVNAVAAAYVKDADQKEHVRRWAVLERLEAMYNGMEKDLHAKKNEQRELLMRLRLDDPETVKLKQQLADRRMEGALKVALDLSQKESGLLGQIRSRQDAAKKIKTQAMPDSLVDYYLRQDPAFGQYLLEQAEVEQKIRELSARVNVNAAPQVLAPLEREREAVLKQMTEFRTSQLPRVRELAIVDNQQEIEKLERELLGVRDQHVAMSAELTRLTEEAKQAGSGMRLSIPQVDALHSSIERLEESLKEMGKKVEPLKAGQKVSESSTLPGFISGVMPLQNADLPKQLDRGKQLKVAGAAGLGMFGLLLFGVAFLEFRSRKINGADEVTQGLGINLVGTLPALPARARRAAPGQATKNDLHFQSMLSESVDAIRTGLLHAARTDDMQVVMVTSAAGGEGKTSLASHLAASLARAWRKTLLIDGDLRNPACHRLFEQPLEPGFSEVLRGEVGLNDAIRPTAVSRLWMMPAGHWDSHAVQALAQEGVRSMFDQLKEQYDFIVVDSCPVLPVADALLLGQHVDAVVFSILRDVSRAPAVYAAQQRLNNLGIRTLGAVVIGTAGDLSEGSCAYQGAPAGS